MRENIYYWKCDAPVADAVKQQAYFKEKYDRPGLAAQVARACNASLGDEARAIEPLRVDGNHLAFVITEGEEQFFFRAADEGDDDYMLAESRLMALAREADVPVPRVLHTDITQTVVPFRFQIMERCTGQSLSQFHREGTLKLDAVGKELGQLLRRLHSIPLEGFGFVHTDELRQSGRVRGLQECYEDYFRTRLADHLAYLSQHALLTSSARDEIERIFQRQAPRLALTQGVLVHRDPALWNVLGREDHITALIDWDDAVSGDPADDLGMLHCFHDASLMGPLAEGYWGAEPQPDDFRCRVWLHMLRNMLWKTVLRHSLGYFEKDGDFFLNTPGLVGTLRQHTLTKLQDALDLAGGCDAP